MPVEFRADSVAYWKFFSSEAAELKAPLYARFAEGVADDAELRAIASPIKAGQPPANMLFGAVHFLLLRGAQHVLRRFYPNLSPATTNGDAFPVFRDFCLAHRAELMPILKTRVTNTNEVARSAILCPGFIALVRETTPPLNIIEIGPSAGLNLYWDRYAYRYRRDGETFLGGDKASPLVIETPLKGDITPPLDPPPHVAKRIGLEQQPVDLTNEDDRDWLKALIWPDHKERFRRLELALKLNAGWPHDIRAGDALALLEDTIAEIPENETLCIYHTLTTYQFTPEMKRALEDILTLASVRRPIHRLYLERTNGDFPLVLSRYADGAVTSRVLANGGPQGSWLEWR